jgi:hypothetical protein
MSRQLLNHLAYLLPFSSSIYNMFVLNPGGSSDSGPGGSQILCQHLLFFGKFDLYFGVLSLAFVFILERAESKSIEASPLLLLNKESL